MTELEELRAELHRRDRLQSAWISAFVFGWYGERLLGFYGGLVCAVLGGLIGWLLKKVH